MKSNIRFYSIVSHLAFWYWKKIIFNSFNSNPVYGFGLIWPKLSVRYIGPLEVERTGNRVKWKENEAEGEGKIKSI